MPRWLALLVKFLLALIPSGVSSYIDEKKRQGAIADQGAADQRAADRAAIDPLTAEARARKDASDKLSDEDSARRFDSFRKPGP